MRGGESMPFRGVRCALEPGALKASRIISSPCPTNSEQAAPAP